MEEADINASEIPQELIDIIDQRAGKLHSRTGSVLTTLAEVLTRWEELKREETCIQESPSSGGWCAPTKEIKYEIPIIIGETDLSTLRVVRFDEE